MDPSTSYSATSYFADFGLVLFALFLIGAVIVVIIALMTASFVF